MAVIFTPTESFTRMEYVPLADFSIRSTPKLSIMSPKTIGLVLPIGTDKESPPIVISVFTPSDKSYSSDTQFERNNAKGRNRIR